MYWSVTYNVSKKLSFPSDSTSHLNISFSFHWYTKLTRDYDFHVTMPPIWHFSKIDRQRDRQIDHWHENGENFPFSDFVCFYLFIFFFLSKKCNSIIVLVCIFIHMQRTKLIIPHVCEKRKFSTWHTKILILMGMQWNATINIKTKMK